MRRRTRQILLGSERLANATLAQKFMSISIKLSPAAIELAMVKFGEHQTEMALFVLGVVSNITQQQLAMDDVQSRNHDDLRIEALSLYGQLPRDLIIEYRIGVGERHKVPATDVHFIQGVAFYLPTEMIELIGTRNIVAVDGCLAFSPPLPHGIISRPDQPA